MIFKSIALSVCIFCLICPTISILDQTYFKALGISPSQTSKQTIQNAYQEAKKKLNEGTGNQKALELLEQAYKVISDNSLRQKYERYNSVAWKDLPSSIKAEEQDERKGPVINMDVPITLKQLFFGGNITLKYNRRGACPRCEGYGSKNPSKLKTCNHCKGKGYQFISIQTRNGFKQKRQQPCNRCKGTGKQVGTQCPYCSGAKLIPEVAQLSVSIERVLEESHTLVLKNFGDEREIGAPSDLKLNFKQKNDGKWIRTKLNIEYSMDISLQQAIFGVNRQITHLDGKKILVNLPGPVLPQVTKTFNGEGLSSRKDKSKKGDLIVKPKIKFQKFTDQQLDLWQKIFGM